MGSRREGWRRLMFATCKRGEQDKARNRDKGLFSIRQGTERSPDIKYEAGQSDTLVTAVEFQRERMRS